jgi:exosortase
VTSDLRAPTSGLWSPTSGLWPLAIALAALWLPVFYRLSFFWETSDQYSHGWFVPLLAGWIFYTRWQTLPPSDLRPPSSVFRLPSSGFWPLTSVLRSLTSGFWPLAVCLSLVLLPLAGSYFIAEANPGWRMMMWIMAACAFLGSLALTQIFGGTTWTKHLWFAFFFLLVSVPWPFGFERWLTLELSMLAARISTALLTLGGIPAVCVGNTIEVSTGVLGVDDACSGIRSFQSSIMAGLFLGELYMLRLAPRVILCLAGLVIAYGLNIARMLILSIAVETTGTMEAISQWHDPAGFAILIATMAILWTLCALAAKSPALVSATPTSGLRSPTSDLRPPTSDLSVSSPATSLSPSPFVPSSLSPLVPQRLVTRHTFASGYLRFAPVLVTIAVIAASLLTAISTEAWFRYQESRKLVKLPEWSVTPADAASGFTDNPMPDYVGNLLGQDIGFDRSWTDDNGRQWHLIYLQWLPGNMKAEGGPHAPDACQTAHGRTITDKSEERRTEVHGIPLPYHLYTISAGGQPFHLMYVLNDETFAGERIGGLSLFEDTHRFDRIRRALAGQRRTGNRSLQLALVGESDAQAAEQAMLQTLPQLIQRHD